MGKKRRPQDRGEDGFGFPWEADGFFEEDTSEYPELGDEPARVAGPVETPDNEIIQGEDTDEDFEQTDSLVDEPPSPNLSTPSTPERISVERFFPDVPEAPRGKESSSASGLLRTAEDISRVIALNRPRPGPLLGWFLSLKPGLRQQISKGAWMLLASLLIVSLFSLATLGIFPLMEGRFTATFGPRPEKPERFFPEPGAAFGLVEDRPYRHDRFIAGMDCIWVTSDPVQSLRIADFGPYLEQDGEMIAVLDVQDTWNGMSRLYFNRGDIPLDEPVRLVIPIEGGGTIYLGDGLGYRLRTPGGDTPARLVLGPLTFKEELTQ